jgi:hypothetical protein
MLDTDASPVSTASHRHKVRALRSREIAAFADGAPGWTGEELRRRARTIGRLAAEAAADGDLPALEAMIDLAASSAPRPGEDAEREFRRGVFEMLANTAKAMHQILQSNELLASVTAGSLAHQMLLVIEREPGTSNAQLQQLLGGARDDAVSRAGRILTERGLARKDRHGRRNLWQILPRGERILDVVGRA